jgi:hypothetical protein
MSGQSADNFHVEFSGDLRDLSASIREAGTRISALEKQTNTSMGNVEKKFASAGSNVRNALGGYVSAQLVSQIASLVGQTAKLGHAAETAGVTAGKYQELRIAFRDAGVEGSKFDNIMQQFASKMGEVKSKSGEFYTFLRQQAPELAKQLSATRTQGEAFDVLADAIARMDTAENKALLAKKALGESGLELIKVLQGGKAGFEATGQAARDAGRVMSDETLKSADDLNKKFNALTGTINDWAKNAVVKVAGMAVALASVVRIRPYFDAGDMGAAEHAAALGDISRAYLDATKSAQKFNAWQTTVQGAGTINAKPDTRGLDQILQLRASLASARGETFTSIAMEQAQSLSAVKKLYEELGMSEAQYQDARGLIAAKGNAATVQARRQINDQLKQLEASSLEASEDTLGAVRIHHEMEIEDFRRMAEAKLITDQQFAAARDQIAAKTSKQIKDYMESEAEKTRQAVAPLSSVISSALSDPFAAAEMGSKKFFTSLAQDLAKAAYQMTVMKPLMDGLFGRQNSGSSGILGNLLSGIVPGTSSAASGGWSTSVTPAAEGGGMRAGVPHLINERTGRKGEIFVPSVAGRMVPGERAGSVAGGASASGSNVYNIDARGADIGVIARVEAAMIARERSRPNPRDQLATYAKRFPARAA